MRTGRNAFTAFLMAAAATISAQAGEGRIPLYQQTTIVTPGHYVLTRDVAASAAGGAVFDIQADGVTLSLNGHTVTCAPPEPCISIGGSGGMAKGVAIAGGTITGGMYGIRVLNAERRHISLKDLRIMDASDTAVKVDNAGLVEVRGIIIVNSMVGIDLQGPAAGPTVPAARISGSSVQAQVGIQCTGMTCNMNDNTLTFAKSAIRLLNSKGSTAEKNSLAICPTCFNPQPEPPIRIVSVEQSEGVRIHHNSLIGDPTPNGDNHGIYFDAMSHDAFIAHNTIRGLGDDGIHLLSNNSWIMHNLINGNMGHGLLVGGSNNLVSGNKVAANGGDGLNVTGMHGYSDNWLLGNNNALGGSGVSDLIDGGGNQQ